MDGDPPLTRGLGYSTHRGIEAMSEKQTETVVLDEALLKEIVSEGEDRPAGESRLVRIRPDADGDERDEPETPDR